MAVPEPNATQAPLVAPTAAEIAAGIKKRLFSGALHPGQRLIETELAEEYAVGRSRVREAFRLLVGEGHLVFVANRGVLVPRYSRQELLDKGRAREVLESLAARLAAEKSLSPNQRDALRGSQARMDAAQLAGDVSVYSQENREYHQLIERIAGNRHVSDLIEKVRVPFLGLRLPHSFPKESIEQSNEGHRLITHAILAGMPEVAEAAMRAHVQGGNAHTAALPDSAFG